MRLLFIGDIFAAPGYQVTKAFLERYRDDYDGIIANGENVAAGRGINRRYFKGLLEMGVDMVTLGNHAWSSVDALELTNESLKLIRPLNFPAINPGLGHSHFYARTGEKVTVINAIGQVFMDGYNCPFDALDNLLTTLPSQETILVDFHAEATSEKKLMHHHLVGRVSAVIGTHTHVQTADETIKKGTAYITDVGMTGVQDSAIGMDFTAVHQKFVHKYSAERFKPAEGQAQLCAVSLEINKAKAQHIERIQWAT
ncbi:MAG: TIGR00282 family metallophosphoesterase [Deinococcales bacterium]